MERRQLNRVLWVAVPGVLLELGLHWLAVRAPAVAELIWPFYWVVGIALAVGLYHTLRKRSKEDRRHANRRDQAD